MPELRADIWIRDVSARDAFIDFAVQVVPEGIGHLDHLPAPHLFPGVGHLLPQPGVIPIPRFQQPRRFADDIAGQAALTGSGARSRGRTSPTSPVNPMFKSWCMGQ